jgi:NADH:ubiquinone reductase (H+-translocating)
LLAAFDARLGAHAQRVLEARGVDVRTGLTVDRVTATAVHLAGGEELAAGTLVWAAGIKASPLGAVFGLDTDRAGRVIVGPDLRVPARPEVWVIGDLAAVTGVTKPLPQVAPVAIQQAHFIARELRRVREGRPAGVFRYRDKGSMATIGRDDAVAELPLGLRFTGRVGWVMWLGLHLIELVGFRNRASVLVDWAWNYVTWDRGARIIVTPPAHGAGPSRPA